MKPESPYSSEMLDEIIGNARTSEDVFGADGLFKNLQKALLNRILDAEMNLTVGYARGEEKPQTQDNYRNGSYPKTLTTIHFQV
jgi:putative transposase